MAEYTYVPSRIRQSTCMYSVVYDRVHICLSYMYSVLYVLCSIRPGTYMYSNSASGYNCESSLSTFGEVDPI